MLDVACYEVRFQNVLQSPEAYIVVVYYSEGRVCLMFWPSTCSIRKFIESSVWAMFDVRAVRRMIDSTSMVSGVALYLQVLPWTLSALVVSLRV